MKGLICSKPEEKCTGKHSAVFEMSVRGMCNKIYCKTQQAAEPVLFPVLQFRLPVI